MSANQASQISWAPGAWVHGPSVVHTQHYIKGCLIVTRPSQDNPTNLLRPRILRIQLNQLLGGKNHLPEISVGIGELSPKQTIDFVSIGLGELLCQCKR